MLDHVSLAVSDYVRARDFYVEALKPLGIAVAFESSPETPSGERYCGFGRDGRLQFWIGAAETGVSGVHVAFAARDRASVRAFHTAALATGGRDNGAPGLRPHYHEHYYGAFVFDPDGNNIEAVCHLPE